MSNNKISAIIPAYSDISIVNNSVLGLITQWIPDNTFELEIILVNDNDKKPNQYDWYLSDDFKQLIKPHISIRIIKNKKNVGQGMSRNIGIKASKTKWFVLCDEDDIYTPNALYRFWSVIQKEHMQGETEEEQVPISVVGAPLYAFDIDSENTISGANIWVNSKLYNRDFLEEYDIWFPDGANSHRSEDYPFIRCLDYAIAHTKKYKRIDFADESYTFYSWVPNVSSRTRCDEHYSSLLAGYTMNSSNIIFDYCSNFNKKFGIEEEEDEGMKHEILNMNAYAFYNYLWFIKDLATDWKDCKEEYWIILRDSVNNLREKLKYYWDEIVPSDIYDTLYCVKNLSDIRFVESWIGSFEDFITKGHETLEMNFDEIQKYALTLEFDGALHEVHAPYVLAWQKRHS